MTISSRPLPQDRPGLVLCKDGPMLHAPGHKPQFWHPGMAHRRVRHKHDGLLKALNGNPGQHVLDCTFGMGHDALVMLKAGLKVSGLDRCGPLLFYSLSGMKRYAPDCHSRLAVRCGDFRDYLHRAEPESFDYVYMDPMFPRGYTRRSVTWSFMRAMTNDSERLSADTLRSALRVARGRVLLKLAPNEPPPQLPGFPIPYEEGSNRIKFAIWDKQQLRSGCALQSRAESLNK